MKNIYTINMLGAGNVATHLSEALCEAGCTIAGIWNRHIEGAKDLADKTGAKVARSMSDLSAADFWIISVTDRALGSVAADAARYAPQDAIFIHTSGTTPASIFDNIKKRYGVLYPLQTFTKGIELDFSEVPCFVEGSDAETACKIEHLAKLVSHHVEIMPSEKRKFLHVAAVFANNFSNLCLAIAQDILQENGIDKNVILPLADQTARKLHLTAAVSSQTGPAVRNDQETMRKHLEILPEKYTYIYKELSGLIHQMQSGKNKAGTNPLT